MASPRTRVGFADTNTWYESTVVLEEHEIELLYTQGAEKLAARRSVIAETRYYESQNCGISLDDIFNCPFQEQVNRLTKLHRDAAPMRGLERSLSDDHREIRSAMRRRLIQAVISQQQAQLKAALTYDERSEVLASISEDLSSLARNFARILAMADQIASENDLEDDCDDDASACSSAQFNRKGTEHKRTASGKLAKMVWNMRKSKSTMRGRANRRNSPASTGDELRESFDLLVRVQQRY